MPGWASPWILGADVPQMTLQISAAEASTFIIFVFDFNFARHRLARLDAAIAGCEIEIEGHVKANPAASAEIGTAAAASNARLAGFSASLFSPVQAYSAQVPLHMPNTSSPGWNCFTFFPIDSTCPARSNPGTPYLGLSSPVTIRIAKGAPLTLKQSHMLRPAA